MSSLLANAADWFKGRRTHIDGWYEDDTGRYAFSVTVDGQRFIVCAKKYLQDGKASFMADKVVQRAIDQEAYILLFTDGDRRMVFDPVTIDRDGEHGTTARDDRKARGERWIDVDADLSVPFRSWYDGRATPPEPSTPPEPDPDSPVERPWDVTEWGDSDD